MTAFTSSQAGNWSNPATWGGAGVPGVGDTAWVKHAVTVDVDTIVGLASSVNQAGTGTIAISGTAVTGTGTAFTTQLRVGDVITAAGVSRTITAIASDTSASTNQNGTVAAGSAFTFRPRSIYVEGSAGGALTVAAGKRLTVRGDVMCRATTLQLNAGASYRFDSSTAAGNPGYYLYLGCGESNADGATLKAVGTAGSRCAIDSNGSTPGRVLMVYGNSGGSIDLAYADLTDLGSASLDAFAILPMYTGQKYAMDHCTFTRVGRIYSTNFDNIPGPIDVSFTFNELIAPPAGVSPTGWDFLVLNFYNRTTGLRLVRKNSFALPDQDVHLNFGTSVGGLTMQQNVIDRLDTPGGGGNITAFDHNLFYIRKKGSGTDWSFVGYAGDTLSDCYVVNDEGPGQLNEHQVMSNDTPAGGGTWLMLREVFERIGVPATGVSAQDVFHSGTPGTSGFICRGEQLLVLPQYNGRSSGHVRARGGPNGKYEVVKSTLMHDPVVGAGNDDGSCLAGAQYAGYAGMWNAVQNNLTWSKQAAQALTGYLLTYIGSGAPADLVVTANVGGNAYYNAASGTQYDQNGVNGTAITGFNNLKQTTKITNATDVDLGTGANEMTQGPKFVDSTRNLATFDTAYLGNVAGRGAWADATVYAVGDIVSASDPAFYAGATINFRCIKPHTSNASDATNGKPGGATAMAGYRTNWEFASAWRIRKAIVADTLITDSALGLVNADYITTLHTWVRAGFAPQNLALQGAGVGGVDIGAVAVQLPPRTGAIAASLPEMTLIATGQLPIKGSESGAFAEMTLAATGTLGPQPRNGAIAASFDEMTLVASAFSGAYSSAVRGPVRILFAGNQRRLIAKQGDTVPPSATLFGPSGPQPLKGAIPRLNLRRSADDTLLLDHVQCPVTDVDAGTLELPAAFLDLEQSGEIYGECEVTFADGSVLSFPNDGSFTGELVAEVD